jgi:transcriptional regulator with XRE-family HTH domain
MGSAHCYTVGSMRQPTDEQRLHRERAGDLIRRARDQANVSQEKLAKELGVSRSAVASYERGTSGLLVDRLPIIHRVLHLTPEALAYPPDKSKVIAADLKEYLGPVSESDPTPVSPELLRAATRQQRVSKRRGPAARTG